MAVLLLLLKTSKPLPIMPTVSAPMPWVMRSVNVVISAEHSSNTQSFIRCPAPLLIHAMHAVLEALCSVALCITVICCPAPLTYALRAVLRGSAQNGDQEVSAVLFWQCEYALVIDVGLHTVTAELRAGGLALTKTHSPQLHMSARHSIIYHPILSMSYRLLW